MAGCRSRSGPSRRGAIAAAVAAAAAALVIAAIAMRAPAAPPQSSVARRTPARPVAAAPAEARVLVMPVVPVVPVVRAAAALADLAARSEDADPPVSAAPPRDEGESEAQQDWLDDYAGGIEHVAPLSDDQRARLFVAQLRHKAIFERDVGLAHLDRPALTADERARAHAIVNEAVDRYRDALLRDAAEILDDQQRLLLTSYETTEMERARQRLQIAINLK